MFAIAARKKLRFDTTKGQLSAEDLWDLPLISDAGRPNLDDIAKVLYKTIKDGEEVSFVTSTAKSSTAFAVLKTKFDIVKYIIDIKLEDAGVAKKAKLTKERNQRIMELMAQKDDDVLASKSKEELMAMLAEGNDEA